MNVASPNLSVAIEPKTFTLREKKSTRGTEIQLNEYRPSFARMLFFPHTALPWLRNTLLLSFEAQTIPSPVWPNKETTELRAEIKSNDWGRFLHIMEYPSDQRSYSTCIASLRLVEVSATTPASTSEPKTTQQLLQPRTQKPSSQLRSETSVLPSAEPREKAKSWTPATPFGFSTSTTNSWSNPTLTGQEPSSVTA